MNTNVLIVGLYLLVLFQIIVGIAIAHYAIRFGMRAERLLHINEAHARLTDAGKDKIAEMVNEANQEAKFTAKQIAKAAVQATEEVKQAVEKVPDKVVERIQEAAHPSGDPFLPAVDHSLGKQKKTQQPETPGQ